MKIFKIGLKDFGSDELCVIKGCLGFVDNFLGKS